MDNKELLKKADMALGDLAAGGRLSVEQSNSFLRTVMDAPTLLNQARQVVMTAPEREINKIGLGSRILRPAVEGTGLAVGDRSKVDLGKVTLQSKEVIAELRLPYTVIEDNIERGSVNFGQANASGGILDTILTLIGQRAALDLEELAILGDTGSGDAFLAMVDGWLVDNTAHTVDAVGAVPTRSLFTEGLKALPDKYKRDRRALRHFVGVNAEIDYGDSLAGRETAMGDSKHQNATPNYAAGVMVEGVAQMPAARGILTVPRNLIFGIHRDISLEYEKMISERMYKIVLTARVDFKTEETDAVVVYDNIGSL